MNFGLDEDQTQIKRIARELLTERSGFERVRAAAEDGRYDEALWTELRELGWPGIAVAEEHGGQGLGTVELVVLLEELGYAVAVTPLLGTVLAAAALQHAGSGEQRARWLPGLASGELTGALGTARDGVAELVPDGAEASVIVLVDGDGGGARVLPRAEATVEPVTAIDPTRRYARVTAAPGAGEPLEGDVAGGVDRATVAVAAELVGICQRALEMTVAYVKERRQFDTPVGAYQAVSHRCAQMLRDTEGARSAAYYAAWTADADSGALPEGAALAKAAASSAGRAVTASAIQAHGGIGFTWEADVHWLFKRAQLDSVLLGGAGAHRARLAQCAAARAGAAGGYPRLQTTGTGKEQS
jgi:alkylation response protein AidB-like acyl-CoA dehydrogenase